MVPDRCQDRRLLYYDEICMLGEQVERLLNLVDSERILFILLDDLRNDPRAVYEKVCTFLDVRYDGRTNFPTYNTKSSARIDFLREWLVDIGRMAPISGGTGLLAPLHRTNANEEYKGTMSDDFRNQLRHFFADDIRKLMRLIGRDLYHWLPSSM